MKIFSLYLLYNLLVSVMFVIRGYSSEMIESQGSFSANDFKKKIIFPKSDSNSLSNDGFSFREKKEEEGEAPRRKIKIKKSKNKKQKTHKDGNSSLDSQISKNLIKSYYKLLKKHDKNPPDTNTADNSTFFPIEYMTKLNYINLLNQTTSNSVLKTSLPYIQILRVVNKFFTADEKKKINEEVIRIRKMDIEQATDKIIEFSELIKKATDEKTYWFYYKIAAKVILEGKLVKKHDGKYVTLKWEMKDPSHESFLFLNKTENKANDSNHSKEDEKNINMAILPRGEDLNYDELLEKDEEYYELISDLKLYTLYKLRLTMKQKPVQVRDAKKKHPKELLKLRKQSGLKKLKTNMEKLNKNKSTAHKKKNKSKDTFDKFVKGQLNYREWKGDLDRNQIRLSDFEPNIFLYNEIKKTEFYKLLANFPKGVVHHLHWSAAFYMGDIMRVMDNLMKTNLEEKKIPFIVKAEVFLEDSTRPTSYFDVPATKIFFIEDVKKILTENDTKKIQQYEENFKKYYILADGRCVLKPIGIFKDMNFEFKALGYLRHCKNAIMYVKYYKNFPKMNFFKGIKIKKLEELTKFLIRESHILEDQKILQEDYLPNSYKNLLFSIKDQVSVAVWFKFEMIFGIYSELFKSNHVFKVLTDYLKEDLLKDKVIGVEFRQGYDLDKGKKSKINILKKMAKEDNSKKSLPVSFILPGRKLKSRHKLKRIFENLKHAKKNNETSVVGFDFFGYEDDPFTGARNFFPLSIASLFDRFVSHTGNKAKNQKKNEVKEPKILSFFEKKFHKMKKSDFLSLLQSLRNGNKMYLHAGETLYFPNYPVSRLFYEKFYINDNLIHAALMPNVERVGHGFALSNNELLMNIYKKKIISLEMCPTSNQALQYYDIEDNPIVKLLRKGLSVTVSPDDPGLFFYSGVRMDWFNLLMSTDLKISEYYLLIRNSILKSSIDYIQDNKEILLEQAKNDIIKFFESKKLMKIVKKWKGLVRQENSHTKRTLRISKYQKRIRIEMINEKNKLLENNLKNNADKIVDKKNNPYINVYDIDDLLGISRKNIFLSKIKRSKYE